MLRNVISPIFESAIYRAVASVFDPRTYGGTASFDPASLFTGGYTGGWHDPSDLSTMFQDTSGQVPVSADGQPVSIILDKSQGLAIGSELVPNGDFSSGTGWTLTSATITGGKLVCNSGTAFVFYARQTVPVINAGVYLITATVSNYISGQASVGVTTGGAGGIIVDGNGTFSGYAFINNGAFDVVVQGRFIGFVGDIDDISIKKISGNHLTQATAGARPLYKTSGGLHWLQYDNIDDVLANTELVQGTTFTAISCRADVASRVGGRDCISMYRFNGGFSLNVNASSLTLFTSSNGAGGLNTDSFSRTFVANESFVMTGGYTGTNTIVRGNKGTRVSTARSFVKSPTNGFNLGVGTYDSNTRLDGKWYGGLTIDRYLTTTEQDDYVTYVGAKGGLTL